MTAKKDHLESMIQAADKKILEKLIFEEAAANPRFRRRCFDYLKKSVNLTSESAAEAEAENAFSLWAELENDLAELDEYGGGEDEVTERVDELLFELAEKLKTKNIPSESRRELLEEVLPYIKSGNAGMDDSLYEVAHASCRDDDDRRHLAGRLESLKEKWAGEHARRIYLQLGDKKDYLRLRLNNLVYGGDFFELADFYWRHKEKEKALEIGRLGLAKGQGRMTELRKFMADRAESCGDRAGSLDLRFQETMEELTAEGYRLFKSICKAEEWAVYEPRILKRIERANCNEQVKIRLLRGEMEAAADIISKERYSRHEYSDFSSAARRLEKSHPEKILKYYQSGLVRFDRPMTRKEYAHAAVVLSHIRRVLLEPLKDPGRWNALQSEIRRKNERRPAFHQEMRKKIPDWAE